MQKLNKGKKGNKKRNYDIFSKKEWYDVKCPTYFNKTKVRPRRCCAGGPARFLCTRRSERVRRLPRAIPRALAQLA